MQNIQIPKDLFVKLIKYFLLDVQDEETYKTITKGINAKLEAITRHELYTTYKRAATAEEQETARQAYLDKIGVSEDFRW